MTDNVVNFGKNETIATKEVVMVRLITGEVLIGFIVKDSNPAVLVLESASLIAMQYTQDGKVNVNMVPYIPFSKENKFVFSMGHVLNVMSASDGLEEKFRSMHSPILTPPKPSFKL
jgi:hypothetical protein